MGKLSRGYLGGFQGQLGTAYGCFWRLQDLVKAMPRKVKRAATEAQLPARLKMALIVTFLSRMRDLIKIGFRSSLQPGKSAMNVAVSYNLNHAVVGISPDFSIDFTKIRFSKGNLPLPRNINTHILEPSAVKFDWMAIAPGSSEGSPDDKGVFIVYNELKDMIVCLKGVAKRSDLQFVLMVPPDFSGENVHCYISFISANGKEVSNTYYCGRSEIL